MELNTLKQPITLDTNRLIIQSMNADDFPLFHRLQTDKALMKYIGPILPTEQVQEKYAARIAPWDDNEDQWLTLKITVKHCQSFAGSIGFRMVDINSKRAEIGYLLVPEMQGRGFMIEAARALVAFLFEQVGVMKIEARCCTVNNASWQVMEKLGMQREAHFISHSLLNQQWYDDYAYGLLSPKLSNKKAT